MRVGTTPWWWPAKARPFFWTRGWFRGLSSPPCPATRRSLTPRLGSSTSCPTVNRGIVSSDVLASWLSSGILFIPPLAPAAQHCSSLIPLLRPDETVGVLRIQRIHQSIAESLVAQEPRDSGQRLQMFTCSALRPYHREKNVHREPVDGCEIHSFRNNEQGCVLRFELGQRPVRNGDPFADPR